MDPLGPSPETSLTGQCLVAMPGMDDPRFSRSVIYVCAHNEDGAMGLVVNRALEQITFPDILEQLEIESTVSCELPVLFGGPVDTSRGFVLHSAEYRNETTLMVDERTALTATTDVLRDIATGRGPLRRLMSLGYAGWSAGQLDEEIKHNVWLNVPADEDLLFGPDLEDKWSRAIAKLGIDPSLLSATAGHA